MIPGSVAALPGGLALLPMLHSSMQTGKNLIYTPIDILSPSRKAVNPLIE
jgi:hypothetical protein